jgi:hypothetical protein
VGTWIAATVAESGPSSARLGRLLAGAGDDLGSRRSGLHQDCGTVLPDFIKTVAPYFGTSAPYFGNSVLRGMVREHKDEILELVKQAAAEPGKS